MDVSHALTFSSVLRITVYGTGAFERSPFFCVGDLVETFEVESAFQSTDKETLPPPSSRSDLPAELKNLNLSGKSVSSLREKLTEMKKPIDGIIDALPNDDAGE